MITDNIIHMIIKSEGEYAGAVFLYVFLWAGGDNYTALLDFLYLNLLKNKTFTSSPRFILYIVMLLVLFIILINKNM
jgi:hypothetical protein